MPKAVEVHPGKWGQKTVLYDDGEYSAVWGEYERRPSKQLGVRWNGSAGHPGYPNQGGHSLFYIEPEFLVPYVLRGLLDHLALDSETPDRIEYKRRLEAVLQTLGG